jgi:FkbM family methyltransferase
MAEHAMMLRLKAALARALASRIPAQAIGWAFRHRIPNRGLVFDTTDPVITPGVEAQLLFGTYESAEIRLLRRHFRDAETVIDLGSSIGVVASHILSRMSSKGHLICVEANPLLLGCLKRTVSQHSRGQTIDFVNAALHYGDGPALLRTAQQSVDSALTEDATGIGLIEVPSTKLSRLLTDFSVDVEYALVCDIEGAEAGMILEDAEALQQCTFLLAELHQTMFRGAPISPSDMRTALEDQGFRVAAERGVVHVFVRPDV